MCTLPSHQFEAVKSWTWHHMCILVVVDFCFSSDNFSPILHFQFGLECVFNIISKVCRQANNLTDKLSELFLLFCQINPCLQKAGLLLHFQSHVDKRYKTDLLKTMLHHAYALSSTTAAFNEECDKLRSIFSRLDYPIGLINSTIDMFIQNITTKPEKKTDDGNTITVLPFKDQIAAYAVRRQLHDLSSKISVTLQPIFEQKSEQDLKPKEIKPSIISQQCFVYKFACDLYDADYVGCTA